MAPRKTAAAKAKALSRGAVPARRKTAPRSLLRGFPIRGVAVVIGVVGLAALGMALANSRRFQDEVVRPLRGAVEPQVDRAWAETRPWRDHVAKVLTAINTDDVREAIAQRLSGWVQRFR